MALVVGPARFIDRFLRPRLSMFVEGFAVRVIATVSLLISLAMPVMEPGPVFTKEPQHDPK